MTGERIRKIRKLRGMTQRQLAAAAGLSERNGDVRMEQYESGDRVPKAKLMDAIADALDISPLAISRPQVDTEEEVLHVLFMVEDRFGWNASSDAAGNPCISSPDRTVLEYMRQWQTERQRYDSGKISKEEYDLWRYQFAGDGNAGR